MLYEVNQGTTAFKTSVSSTLDFVFIFVEWDEKSGMSQANFSNASI